LCRADIANISYERIYQLILANKQAGGTLYTHLRYANKKRYSTSDRHGQIKNRVSTGKRPPMVADRQHIGDWEGNTIIGKGHQQAIVTLVDRATRLIHIGTVTTKHANIVATTIVELLKPMANTSHTITVDNSEEFAHFPILTIRAIACRAGMGTNSRCVDHK